MRSRSATRYPPEIVPLSEGHDSSGEAMSVTDELLQKVASGQEVLLVEVKRLRDSHGELSEEFQIHRRDDREDFNRVFEAMDANRKERREEGTEVIKALIKRMDEQDKTIKEQRALIDASDKAQARARGAGWVIVGFVTFLGSALIVVLAWALNHIGGKP